MIIQSRTITTLRNTAAYVSTDDEADDDPWSGYGDTLEMELNTVPTSAETYSPQEVQATSNDFVSSEEPDEFTAAHARLNQRGQNLHQQQLRQVAHRPQHPPQYFPHLEQGYGLSGRGYAPTHYYTPAPRPVQYNPPSPVHHVAPTVPQFINIEPDPLAPQQPQALPYEIDPYGNPILPEGVELDPWGNLIPSADYSY